MSFSFFVLIHRQCCDFFVSSKFSRSAIIYKAAEIRMPVVARLRFVVQCSMLNVQY